jgi:phosphoglycerol transferase MdoB-like AlkP superfamily enzyme
MIMFRLFPFRSGLRAHLAFTFLSGLALLLMFGLLRLALLAYNHELIGVAPASAFFKAFGNGLRFDLRIVAWMLTPLLLTLLVTRAMALRGAMRVWLTAVASFALLLGVIELDFYREFQQRLNDLVFQYLEEDPRTVMSMLWYGFPVVRLLMAWAAATFVFWWIFRKIDQATRPVGDARTGWLVCGVAFLVCLMLATLAIRGTLRQGPPLRWGDAFIAESPFASKLGLNGTMTLMQAAQHRITGIRKRIWKSTLSAEEALEVVRSMLLTDHDRLVDSEEAAVRRDFSPPGRNRLPVSNVIVILMESFAGHSVGAMGATSGVTPQFDALAKEGLLFTRFFSNGTHTHQGMFATMACFPNLPGFEYLMQIPEGGHGFSGLPQLLRVRAFANVYVYNGDFAWDNQSGFFGNQGVTNFVGRHDFVNPVVSDPTWGVSDQDMFARANEELDKLAAAGKPFYALLQTLSNHTPYALPAELPVERVTGYGSLDEHLTAMRYSDWALGQFFEKAKQSAYFKDTLFVVVGDHGFGNNEQLTEINLRRFNVPLLLIAPGIREKFGEIRATVASQVDVVPTIMGLLGGQTRHQCWGRDLLSLPEGDDGFAVIKPSGGDPDVAIIRGGRVLVKSKDSDARLFDYRLGSESGASLVQDAEDEAGLWRKLDAFIQIATKSLMENTTGATGDGGASEKESNGL